MSSNDGKYPEPEGWGKDGFWRDPAIDSDYETGLTSPVRPAPDGPREDPGHSYWADGRGWENSPGTGLRPGPGIGQRPGDATSLDATRGAYRPGGEPGGVGGQPAGGAGGNWQGGDPAGFYGAGAGPTAVYGAGPGGPVGPGGPIGPGGPGGRGPGGPARPGGPRVKRKGDWWRRWTWKKSLAVVGSAFMVFILALVGVYYYLASSATIPAALANALDQNTTVYYSDGTTVLGTIGTVDRQNLMINQIPKHMQNAVIAAEDRGFWTEGGISPTGIVRAAYDDLMSSGGNKSGGSTITQEFVRNYYATVGTQQTISRKIKEIFIAQKLASSRSKDWILQNYLNVIYLGDGSYGVSAAAQTYFGEPLSKLTVAQDAVIAAIIQQPSTYYQLQYRSDLITRWHYVLNGMVSIHDLTQAQEDSISAHFPKLLTDSPSYTPPGLSQGCTSESTQPWAAYLMQQVCAELKAPKPTGGDPTNAPVGDGLTSGELEDGGLKVVTTFSEPMEVEMYRAVDENMAQLTVGGSKYAKLPNWALIGAELQNPANGEILAEYPGRGEKMSNGKCVYSDDCEDNTVSQDREQVGSSFKPYDLSTAVQEGMDVAPNSSILNSSTYLCIAPDGSKSYSQAISAGVYFEPGNNAGCKDPDAFKEQNDDGEAIGKPVGPKGDNLAESDVQNALALSSNTAFADLVHRATTTAVITMAQNYGVNISVKASGLGHDIGLVPQVALGAGSLTVNEQAQMLATIDDGGVFHMAHVIKYWQLPLGPEQTPVVVSRIVLTPAQDSEVQYAMAATTVYGTATNASVGLGDRPIIGKTGTTSGWKSAFFLGAIPQYALAIGMFTDLPSIPQSMADLGGNGVGGYWPAKIWNTFAQAEFSNLPVENFLTTQFSGQKWNMIGKLPKAKPKKPAKCGTAPVKGRGRMNPAPAQVCPTPTPTPTPPPTPTSTASAPAFPTPTATATPTPTPPGTSPGPTPTGTATTTSTTTTPPPLPTGPPPPTNGGGPPPPPPPPPPPGHGQGASADSAATMASGVKAGLGVGGLLVTLLPGSLLWTSAARRRRKR